MKQIRKLTSLKKKSKIMLLNLVVSICSFINFSVLDGTDSWEYLVDFLLLFLGIVPASALGPCEIIGEGELIHWEAFTSLIMFTERMCDVHLMETSKPTYLWNFYARLNESKFGAAGLELFGSLTSDIHWQSMDLTSSFFGKIRSWKNELIFGISAQRFVSMLMRKSKITILQDIPYGDLSVFDFLYVSVVLLMNVESLDLPIDERYVAI